MIALCDGRDALALPAARDHKRLADGDRGPNTGGMGAYSPLPDLPDEAVEAIVAGVHRPILAELARRGQPVPRRPVRRPDPDRRRPGPARVQCPLRRSRDAGDPAPPGGPAGSTPASRRPSRAGRRLSGQDAPAGPARRGRRDRPRQRRLPRTDRGAATSSAGSLPDRTPPTPRAGMAAGLVFQSGTTQVDTDGAVWTNGGRVLTVVGLGTTLEAARQDGRATRGRHRLRRPPAPPRHRPATCRRRPSRPARSRPEFRHDPALHPGRDGRHLVGAGPLRGDAPGGAGGGPRPGGPRA